MHFFNQIPSFPAAEEEGFLFLLALKVALHEDLFEALGIEAGVEHHR